MFYQLRDHNNYSVVDCRQRHQVRQTVIIIGLGLVSYSVTDQTLVRCVFTCILCKVWTYLNRIYSDGAFSKCTVRNPGYLSFFRLILTLDTAHVNLRIGPTLLANNSSRQANCRPLS